MSPDSTAAPKDLIGFLDYYLVQKAPFQIPQGAKEWIVKYGPWALVVLLVLMIPLLLIALGISAIAVPLAAGTGQIGAAMSFLTLPLLLVTVGLEVAALPGLFARKMMGWKLALYARLIAIAWNVLSLAIVSAIIGGAISLYILMQVRPLYNGTGAPAGRPAGV